MINCRVLKNGVCEITQYYGGNFNHLGIDVVGNNYTIDDVVSHSDGIVIMTQTGQVNNQGSTGNASYGNFVKIDHGSGWFTLYAHLATVNVKTGDKVSKSSIIGKMGNTGNSYGAHLHFEVWKNNERINPYEYLDKNLFEVVTNPVLKDETRDQLKVNVDDLRIRTSASITSPILGFAVFDAMYNSYEIKENEGYIWYRINDNEWIASNGNWITVYPKKSNEIDTIQQLKLEIEKFNQQIDLLQQENKILKNNYQDFKIFGVPEDGLYYIELFKNQKLIYKKM